MPIPPVHDPGSPPPPARAPVPRAPGTRRTVPLTIGIVAALLVIALSAGGIWYVSTTSRPQAGAPAATTPLSAPASAETTAPSLAASTAASPTGPADSLGPSSDASSSPSVPTPVSLSPIATPPKATTTVTVTKAPTTTRPPSSAAAPKTTLRYQGSDQQATFRYFTALLNGDPVRNGADPTELRIYVAVCVKELPPGSTGGVTRVSRDSWSVRNSKGQVGVVRQKSLTPTFPTETTGAVGSCFDGYLSYTTPAGFFDAITGLDVVYADGVGETAIWAFR